MVIFKVVTTLLLCRRFGDHYPLYRGGIDGSSCRQERCGNLASPQYPFLAGVGPAWKPGGRMLKTTMLYAAEQEENHQLDDAFYDIENVTENKMMELRKGGIHLTNAVRQIYVDYEDCLKDLDNRVEVLEKEKERLKLEKTYVKVAHQCFTSYIRTGSLTVKFTDEEDETSLGHQRYMLAKEVKENFDKDLFAEKVAKYGFVYLEEPQSQRGSYRGKVYREVSFTLGLLSESSASD